MSFVIYDKDTTCWAPITNYSFQTERAAKGALTKALNKGLLQDREQYRIADYSDFINNIEKTVVVKNLMSGKDVKQSANTPRCCDPSSELYWSM